MQKAIKYCIFGTMLDIISNQSFILYALGALVIILIGWIVRLEIKIHKLLSGKDGKSLENSILQSIENLGRLNSFQKEAIDYFENIEKRLRRSIQAVETIRFNPFKGTGDGGNQSFSTTLINEKGDGVVVSSLYSRDRVSVFSKPIKKFESSFELTEEERATIANSKESLK